MRPLMRSLTRPATRALPIVTLTVLLAAGAARAAEAPGGAPPAPAVVPIAPAAEPPQAGLIRDPAPRPAPALRVQARYAHKAGRALLSFGFEYLARGDFFISPGARLGLAYYLIEPFAFEVQISHYWSSLNAEAERIKQTLGALPDSHAPGWLMLAGARYSIGYGKLLIGGMGTALHFEPQAFLHLGGHLHDGDSGFSSDAGLGLLMFMTPRMFGRIDVALLLEREKRSGVDVSVWGVLPSFSLGGVL